MPHAVSSVLVWQKAHVFNRALSIETVNDSVNKSLWYFQGNQLLPIIHDQAEARTQLQHLKSASTNFSIACACGLVGASYWESLERQVSHEAS